MRESQKLSREKLAEMSNISTQFLADIETGKKGMTVTTLKKLCNALYVTADYIVYGTTQTSSVDIAPVLSVLDAQKQEEVKEIIQKI